MAAPAAGGARPVRCVRAAWDPATRGPAVWGEVTPAERLRAITRRMLGDGALAAEAADALAGFASEPASLVVACRRVLSHHRAHGTLWWVCARILAAADPATAARDAARRIEQDATPRRLAAALPLVDEGEVVAVVGWRDALDAALAERADLPVLALRTAAGPPGGPGRRPPRRHVEVVGASDPAPGRVARLLVAADAIGPAGALVPAGTGEVLAGGGRAADAVWLVGGVGRVLPGRLFDAVVAACAPSTTADADGSPHEVVALERFDRVAGPYGVEAPADAAIRVDCPVAPELLRPLD